MYSDEGKTRLRRELREEAIALAMQNRWEEAVEANKNLIESFPTDVDAFNRLGRSFMELSRYSEAREAYGKAVELAPGNVIARKNLERLSALTGPEKKSGERKRGAVAPDLFVREMGKSRVVSLYHVASQRVLAGVAAGDQVFLVPKGKHLLAETAKKECLGWVDPRYEPRLLKLIQGGNRYAGAVVSINGESVKVMITETFQHPSQFGKLSFPEDAAAVRAGKDTLLRRGAEEEGLDEVDMRETEANGEGEEVERLPEGFTVMDNTAQIAVDLEDDEGKEGHL